MPYRVCVTGQSIQHVSIRPVISIKLVGGGGLDEQNLCFTILIFLRLSEYLG